MQEEESNKNNSIINKKNYKKTGTFFEQQQKTLVVLTLNSSRKHRGIHKHRRKHHISAHYVIAFSYNIWKTAGVEVLKLLNETRTLHAHSQHDWNVNRKN